jgi:hypothetical protein
MDPNTKRLDFSQKFLKLCFLDTEPELVKSRNRNRNWNLSKVGTGTVKNSYGSATPLTGASGTVPNRWHHWYGTYVDYRYLCTISTVDVAQTALTFCSLEPEEAAHRWQHDPELQPHPGQSGPHRQPANRQAHFDKSLDIICIFSRTIPVDLYYCQILADRYPNPVPQWSKCAEKYSKMQDKRRT